jgi:hypothetical protein
MYELDDILAEEGKSRYFIPAIKNKLNELQLNESIDYVLSPKLKGALCPEGGRGIEDYQANSPLRALGRVESIKILDLTQLNEDSKKEFESQTGMNVVEAQKMYNYITENRNKLEFKNNQLIKIDPTKK